MTLIEAAEELGLSPTTLRVQLRNGKLHGKKVGPVWTLTPKEVERYRRESRRPARNLLREHGEELHTVPVEGCRACDQWMAPVQPITDTTSAIKYGVAGAYAAMESAEE